MAENESYYPGAPTSQADERIGHFIDQYVGVRVIDERSLRVLIIPKEAMLEAGFSLDPEDAEGEIDLEDFEELLQTAIDPSLN